VNINIPCHYDTDSFSIFKVIFQLFLHLKRVFIQLQKEVPEGLASDFKSKKRPKNKPPFFTQQLPVKMPVQNKVSV